LSSRDALVRSRTALINHARGVVKTMGERLPSCSSAAFVHKALAQVPAVVGEALAPLFQVLESLNAQIHEYERQVKRLCEQTYPQTQQLCQVNGVGQLTALAYVVTLETAVKRHLPLRDKATPTVTRCRWSGGGRRPPLVVGRGWWLPLS